MSGRSLIDTARLILINNRFQIYWVLVSPNFFTIDTPSTAPVCSQSMHWSFRTLAATCQVYQWHLCLLPYWCLHVFVAVFCIRPGRIPGFCKVRSEYMSGRSLLDTAHLIWVNIRFQIYRDTKSHVRCYCTSQLRWTPKSTSLQPTPKFNHGNISYHAHCRSI